MTMKKRTKKVNLLLTLMKIKVKKSKKKLMKKIKM